MNIPSFPGKLRLVDLLGRLAGRVGGGSARFSRPAGAPFEVDLGDRIQRYMWGGCYEPHLRRCFEALLEQGDTFVDIGAHIGYHSVTTAGLVGPEGNVFAFEPDPILYKRLVRNVRHFDWVRAFPFAIWQSSGSLEFERSPFAGESGWGTLTSVRDLRRGEHVAVRTVSLDDWLEEPCHQRLRAIKIDAEGSELAILKGAGSVLQRFRPVIVLEMNDTVLRQAGSSSTALASHLMSLDYDLFGLSRTHLEHWERRQCPHASEVLSIPRESVETTLDSLRRAGFKS